MTVMPALAGYALCPTVITAAPLSTVIVSTMPAGCGWHSLPRGPGRYQRHSSTGAVVGVVEQQPGGAAAGPRRGSAVAASVTCTGRAAFCSTSVETETPSASAIRTSVARFGLAVAFSSATSAPLLTPARAASWSAQAAAMPQAPHGGRDGRHDLRIGRPVGGPPGRRPGGLIRGARRGPAARPRRLRAVSPLNHAVIYSSHVLAVLLAAASSVGYGVADFVGGLAPAATRCCGCWWSPRRSA